MKIIDSLSEGRQPFSFVSTLLGILPGYSDL
jgi:hypothetical protein